MQFSGSFEDKHYIHETLPLRVPDEINNFESKSFPLLFFTINSIENFDFYFIALKQKVGQFSIYHFGPRYI